MGHCFREVMKSLKELAAVTDGKVRFCIAFYEDGSGHLMDMDNVLDPIVISWKTPTGAVRKMKRVVSNYELFV